MKTIIGVMGPGRGASLRDRQHAFELGKKIAQEGWVLLTGGRNEGVMDAASRGGHEAGGLVIGILPEGDYLSVMGTMSPALDIPIITGIGHARNVINILSSQIIIACGMGLGTASEVALALKSGVPVILLNNDAKTEQFFRHAAGEGSDNTLLQRAETCEEAIAWAYRFLQTPTSHFKNSIQ